MGKAELGAPSAHPNWSPELSASVARIEAQLADGNPRVKVGKQKCHCGKFATVYSGDPRARGWLRFECKCGDWGDKDPNFKDTPEKKRMRAEMRKAAKRSAK